MVPPFAVFLSGIATQRISLNGTQSYNLDLARNPMTRMDRIIYTLYQASHRSPVGIRG